MTVVPRALPPILDMGYEGITGILQEASHTQASTHLGHPLRDHIEGRNGSTSTRALKLPDGTSAAWYILTIFGIFSVVFLFQLASNILRRSDKSLEDTYYSNVNSELKKKGLQNNVPRCSAQTISNRAVLQPTQPSLRPAHANSSPPVEIPGAPGSQGKPASLGANFLGWRSSSESTCNLERGVKPSWGWKSTCELGAFPANRGVSGRQHPGSFSGFPA
ncbi:small integral membrane protein 34 [Talpa occidentalis]|uniref:small integral membrane protein 34 n=1 Tax=Talpa occidentalis TaxID=50954 RepID=UPI00188FB713|nr:small integral membrane protein 34 [Talpa occidentalis]